MESPDNFSREYNDLTYQQKIVIETIREWILLLAGIAFCVLFVVSIVHLLRTWRKWTFDVSVIFICLVQIVLIVLEQFWINNIKTDLFVLSTQTAVLLSIVFVFIRFFLKTLDKLPLLHKAALPITVILGIVILATMISGLAEMEIFSCGFNNFTFQWFLISAINLALAITTMIFSAIMKEKLRETAGKIELDNHDIKFLRMRLQEYSYIRRQLSVLELWVFIISIIRLIWYVVAHTAINEDELTCWTDNFYVAVTEGGAVFLLIKTIFIDYGPQVIFWVVFYQLPYSFQFLVVKQKKDQDIDLRRRSHQFTLVQKKELINSLIENDDKEIQRITLTPTIPKEFVDLQANRETTLDDRSDSIDRGEIPSAVGDQFAINSTFVNNPSTDKTTAADKSPIQENEQNPFQTLDAVSSNTSSIDADRGIFSVVQPPKRKIGKKKGPGKKEARDRTSSLMK